MSPPFSLEEAAAAEAGFWRTWNALGQLYDREGKFGDAGDAYEKAIAIRPNSAEVHNNMGVSLLMQERYKEAGKAFRKTLRLDPALAIAETNYRLTLAWEGKYWQAVANLRKDARLSMLNNVGVIAMRKGDLEEAETLFVQAIEKSPSHYAIAVENLAQLKDRVRLENRKRQRDKTTSPKTGS